MSLLEKTPFHKELESLINRYSQETHSNTPDFILAEYLLQSLQAWEWATNKRDEWHGGGVIKAKAEDFDAKYAEAEKRIQQTGEYRTSGKIV